MGIEAKDVFMAVVAGASALSALLLVFMGFLLNTKVSLEARAPMEARKYLGPIWVITFLVVVNSIITLASLAWPLGVLKFISDPQIEKWLLGIFVVPNIVLIPLAIWVAWKL